MIICIVEDEPLIAKRIERIANELLNEKITKVVIKHSLDEAKHYLFEHNIDLLLLDLNLNGDSGFDLLKLAVSGSFHTIIISAYSEKAIDAYEYGVLDFLSKPFTSERLQKAFDRFENIDGKNQFPTKYIAVRKQGKLVLLNVPDIYYIKAAGIYSEIKLMNGTTEIHDKSLTNLCTILPSQFIRIHKSYIINLETAKQFIAHGGSKYELELEDGEILPVSRTKYSKLKSHLTR